MRLSSALALIEPHCRHCYLTSRLHSAGRKQGLIWEQKRQLSAVKAESEAHKEKRRSTWETLVEEESANPQRRFQRPKRSPRPSAAIPRMANHMDITFLGTSSANASLHRNHSSLALRLDGNLWLFDVGESTQHQLQRSQLRMGKVNKVFVTHMHGDHVFGLVPFLVSALSGDSSGAGEQKPLEIFGPSGLRQLIRTTLRLTYTNLSQSYRVHELLFPSDPRDNGERPNSHELPGEDILLSFPESTTGSAHLFKGFGSSWSNLRHNAKLSGILAQGSWPKFHTTESGVTISAAPIRHSVPCIGYFVSEGLIAGKINPKDYVPLIERNAGALKALAVQKGDRDFRPISLLGRLQRQKEGEPNIILPDGTELVPPRRRRGRQVMILGDTNDPSPMLQLVQNLAREGDVQATMSLTEIDLLVHEATNAFLPPEVSKYDSSQAASGLDYAGLAQRTVERGHSTPNMAGAFAAKLGMGIRGSSPSTHASWNIMYHLPEDAIELDARAVPDEDLTRDPSAGQLTDVTTTLRGKVVKRRRSSGTTPIIPANNGNLASSVVRLRSSTAKSLLVLNHFSARYGGDPLTPSHTEVMTAVEKIARDSWSEHASSDDNHRFDGEVVSAFDFLQIDVPKPA